MTHASVPKDQRAVLGIDDNFVRISVGIEDADDLINDLNQALEKAVKNIFFKKKFNFFLLDTKRLKKFNAFTICLG